MGLCIGTLDVMATAIAQAAPFLDRNACEKAAVAAVEALRDPPSDIFNSAFPGMPYVGYARADWQAVVDAILTSGQSAGAVHPPASGR